MSKSTNDWMQRLVEKYRIPTKTEKAKRILTEQELQQEYEEFKKSNAYADKINDELELHRVKYSDAEIDNAIKYAFESIHLPIEEIGKDVYQKLWRQHFYEILSY